MRASCSLRPPSSDCRRILQRSRRNGSIDNRRVLVFSEDPSDSSSRQIARFARRIAQRYYPELSVDMVFRRDRFGRGGDHSAFNQEGYAGVRFTTPNENFANQHSATDTFANASPAYTAKVVRINAATAGALALAPRIPVTATSLASRGDTVAPEDPQAPPQSGSRARPRGPGVSRGSGYDAVLRWEHPNPEPDLAGYIVVIRSTQAPDWEREIWAGNLREFTIKNVPIDELVFRVKSVDREGHESPVSAYVLPQRSPAASAPRP